MKKIQKNPARVTRCKRGSSKIHKKHDTRSVAATRMANTRAQKAAHKKNKQINNIRTRAKKALQQDRPYRPKTADAKLKKIVTDMHKSITKRVDNADRKSANATSTANRCINFTKQLVKRSQEIALRQASSQRAQATTEQKFEVAQATTEQRFEKLEDRMLETELQLQSVESRQSQL